MKKTLAVLALVSAALFRINAGTLFCQATLPTDVTNKPETNEQGQGVVTTGHGHKHHRGDKSNKTAGGAATGTAGQSGVSKVIRQSQTEGDGGSNFNQNPGGKNKSATAGVGARTSGNRGSGQHSGRGNKTAGRHLVKQQQHSQGGGRDPKLKPTSKEPSAAILSDLRMKKNVSLVGWSKMGIPIYQFSYINQPNKRYQGTIAQAIAGIRPDAIIWRDGLMWVDYSRLDIRMEELPPTPVKKDSHLCPP